MTDKEGSDKSLKLAAAAVSASMLLIILGAFLVRSAIALVLLLFLEAAILIGAGIVLRKY